MAKCFESTLLIKSPTGCGNQTSLKDIPKLKGKAVVVKPETLPKCSKGRNHEGDGKIKYKKPAPRYELKKGK
jgi:hypothetical protein